MPDENGEIDMFCFKVTKPEQVAVVTGTVILMEGFNPEGEKILCTAYVDGDGSMLAPVTALGLLEYGKLRYLERYNEADEI
jgi:hypothetical protein